MGMASTHTIWEHKILSITDMVELVCKVMHPKSFFRGLCDKRTLSIKYLKLMAEFLMCEAGSSRSFQLPEATNLWTLAIYLLNRSYCCNILPTSTNTYLHTPFFFSPHPFSQPIPVQLLRHWAHGQLAIYLMAKFTK